MARRTRSDFPKRIGSWQDLALLVDHVSYFSGVDWLFRGVTNAEHDLIPKVGRPRAKPNADKTLVPYKLADEKAVLRMFKQQAAAYLPPTARNELEWMALAQHFGVPTRLLDWTDNLLVAVWFATGEPHHSTPGCDGALWITSGASTVDVGITTDPAAIENPMVFRPPHATPRMSAQGSVLMICPDPTRPVSLTATKVAIDGTQRVKLRKRLNAAGINARTMFPDLVGLGIHLDSLYQVGALTGYRSWAPPSDINDEDGP